jgi:Omp85 superfamily domain
MRLRLAYATEASAFRIDFKGQFLETNSRTAAEVYALASGIETLYFFGFGNETPDTASKTFYRVNQAQYLLAPVLKLGPTPHLELRAGPVFQYSATTNTPGRFITSNPPYGSGEFGQIGIGAQVRYDTRDHTAAATRGVFLSVQGTIDPGTWDLVSTYGQINGAVSTYFTAGRMPFKPTLALRLGGKKIWGTFPFQNAAYIGGSSTVRLNISDRYAGDASVYGNAELRCQLTKLSLFLPFQLGLFGLADVGRVFLQGTSSNVWHTAFGGGPWLYILDRAGTLTLAVTGSEGGVGVFFGAGFAY